MTENSTAGIPQDAKTWAMICHLSAIVGFIVPFGNIVAPLIIWQLKKNEFPFVDEQGKEALNFQISITIYLIVSALLVLIAIGILLLIVIGIMSLVLIIIAAINASNGTSYHYPFTIQFIK